MNKVIEEFFKIFFSRDITLLTVYSEKTPLEMMDSAVNEDGWYKWKPIKGTLTYEDYQSLEHKFKVQFPKSFIEWHKEYFFLTGDCGILRLPHSSTKERLFELKETFDYDIASELISLKLYPFADDGGDIGPLVFDAREDRPDNEFPIRSYDYEYGGDSEGLSEIIFSSFPKLLECLTHFLKEKQTRPWYEIFPEFFQIDPEGAGKTGVDYWLRWAMDKEDYSAGLFDDE